MNKALLKTTRPTYTIKTEETDDDLTVTCGTMQLRFNKTTGYLEEVWHNQKRLPISGGPIILTENDSLPEKFTHQLTKNGLQITTTFASGNTIEWNLKNNGLLDLNASFKKQLAIKDYAGISFGMQEEAIQSKKWLGDGPYRVYRNRLKGTRFGIWKNEYNNTITGESGYEYPEFKGFFSNLYWMEIATKNAGAFTVYNHTPFTFLQMLTPDQPSDPRAGATVKDYPPGNLSFLKSIAPIGTKFAPVETLGPQSLPLTVIGREIEPMRIHLTFDFMNGN